MGAVDDIRRKLDTGELPGEPPVTLWGGYGTREACSACGDLIQTIQIGYEFDTSDRGTFRFHAGCFGLWRAELLPPGRRTSRLTP
jgi:hypothetical protein